MDKNYVLNLIKNGLTNEQADELDGYFENNPSDLAKNYTANEIIEIINAVTNALGYNLLVLGLSRYAWDYKFDIINTELDDEQLAQLNKLYKVVKNCKTLSAIDSLSFIGLTIGNHYFYKNDKELALKYFKSEFESDDFYYGEYEYFYKYEKYYDLTVKKHGEQYALKKLLKFIRSGIKNKAKTLDFTYAITYYIREKFNRNLYSYAYKLTNALVTDYRKRRGKHSYFSDTDEERALCELVAIKFEHYVKENDFKKALKTCHELTNEIYKSDCTRYYHARDLFYKDLITKMQEFYPELKFFKFENYGNTYKFSRLNFKNAPNFSEMKSTPFTLINENGLEFNFLLKTKSTDDYIYFYPLLPIGNGLTILAKLSKTENGEYYLTPFF